MLPCLLCKAIFFSFGALHLFREADNLSFLTFFPHFQHELRGLISILSYNLLIGGKSKKCILFHPKRLFPGSTAVSSVSSFKDIKCEKVTTKLLPVHVLGEPQSTSFRVVQDSPKEPHPRFEEAQTYYKGIIVKFCISLNLYHLIQFLLYFPNLLIKKAVWMFLSPIRIRKWQIIKILFFKNNLLQCQVFRTWYWFFCCCCCCCFNQRPIQHYAPSIFKVLSNINSYNSCSNSLRSVLLLSLTL